MSDLIDRQAVRLAKVPYDEQLSEYERGWNDACEAIADNVPSAPRWVRCEDELPVVRCKDCKWFGGKYDDYCIRDEYNHAGEWFCADGERREG